MNKKYTLPAFSIIEAITGLIITAFIMAIIFTIFTMMTDRMLDYKNQNQPINDLNRLTYSLNKDIFENETMTASDSSLSFQRYDGARTAYSFNPDYILRITRQWTDTFKISLQRFSFDTVQNKNKKWVFHRLKLLIHANEDSLNLNFYKKIYANELLSKIKKDEP